MVGCEVIAFVCVLAAAWPANSLTLWANVLRVGLDLPASFFALYVSGRILRKQHDNFDYGLGKWENLASLVNVPVMFAGLIFLAFRAVQSFLNPRPVEHTEFGLGVLMVFAAVNIMLTFRFRNLHRWAPSPLIHAQFILYRNATAASLLALAALTGSQIPGVSGTYSDIAGAVFLAILVAQSTLHLLRQSLSALLDEAVEESLRTRIEAGLMNTSALYTRLHRIRSRHAGDRIFIEVVLEFDPALSVREMLHRCSAIRAEIEHAAPRSEVSIVPGPIEKRPEQSVGPRLETAGD